MNPNQVFEFKDVDGAYRSTALSGISYLNIKSPITVQYEVSSGCNQKCIFCYNNWKEGCGSNYKKQLSKRDQIKVMNKIIKLEVFNVIFSGGEPLLIGWLEELISIASKAMVQTTIITNGALLNKERATSLKKSGLSYIQVSLHHYTSKVNNKLTGQVNSFKSTVEGIKNIIRVFGTEVLNVNMVALPETYKEVYKMANFLDSIGVTSFSIATPTAAGEMKNDKGLVMNKKMFLDIYSQLISAKKDLSMDVGFTGGFPICILPKINRESINMVGNYCDAGLNQMVIDPEGNIKPCVCLNRNLGNILNDDPIKIWKKNKFLMDMRELRYLPQECTGCEYISLCKGGCRASAEGYFGSINAKDPLME